METNQQTICTNCTKPLPPVGYFCGGCMTQFKCKSCDFLLEADYVGCINCGTPKEVKAEVNTASQRNINTFRLHETATDRTIEATFSDDVAKDLAETLRDAAAANRIKAIASGLPPSNNFNGTSEETAESVEAEVVNNENTAPKIEAVHKPVSTDTAKPEEYPILKAIAMKNLPSSETEWIVVYAFYASNYGKEIFNRDNIISQYIESNRFNKETTKRDLSTNLKRTVIAGYINPLQTGYSILEEGITKAKEIITRTSGSSPKPKSSFKAKKENEENGNLTVGKSKKSSNGIKSHKRLTDINFHPNGQKSLTDFIKDFAIKNDNERNLLFTHYLSEILKIKPITLDHLYTCYDEVNHKIPENMMGSVSNTKARTGWLKTDNSNVEITTKGINKIKFWNKD